MTNPIHNEGAGAANNCASGISMTEQQLLPVIQADRNFTANYCRARSIVTLGEQMAIINGKWDETPHVQEVARHRLTTSPHQEEVGLRGAAHGWRTIEVQAIGAAISNRSWHAVEQAYNSLRDKMDRAGLWNKP